MSGTAIKSCKCVNAFQDERYGRGMRVMNVMGKNNGHRCTACGTVYK